MSHFFYSFVCFCLLLCCLFIDLFVCCLFPCLLFCFFVCLPLTDLVGLEVMGELAEAFLELAGFEAAVFVLLLSLLHVLHLVSERGVQSLHQQDSQSQLLINRTVSHNC